MVSARAVKPLRSKKFLASRWPGSASGVDADAAHRLGSASTRCDRHALPHADRACVGLHEEIGDDAEARTGAERLDTTTP